MEVIGGSHMSKITGPSLMDAGHWSPDVGHRMQIAGAGHMDHERARDAGCRYLELVVRKQISLVDDYCSSVCFAMRDYLL